MGEYTYQALSKRSSRSTQMPPIQRLWTRWNGMYEWQPRQSHPYCSERNWITIFPSPTKSLPILIPSHFEGFDELDKLIEEPERVRRQRREEGYTPSPKGISDWMGTCPNRTKTVDSRHARIPRPRLHPQNSQLPTAAAETSRRGKRGRRGSAVTSALAGINAGWENMDKFHDSCDCLVVPVFKPIIGSAKGIMSD